MALGSIPTHSSSLSGEIMAGITVGNNVGSSLTADSTALVACNVVDSLNVGFMFQMDNVSFQWVE